MNEIIKRLAMPFAVVMAVIAFGGSAAYAIPTLQLDIAGGTYDGSTETIVTTDTTFTVYAYLNADTVGDTYYLNISVNPDPGTYPDDVDLGSFSINGGPQIDVTGDMIYGYAPYDDTGWDGQDLPPHGIFPTYYLEYEFDFIESDTTTGYNTQDNPGAGLFDDAGNDMYYVEFEIDTSDFNYDYGDGSSLHFDLYNTVVQERRFSDIDVDDFAPFSHDAEAVPVPEPATALFLGIGLLGFFISGRKLHLRIL